MRVTSGSARIAVDVVGPAPDRAPERDVLFFHAGVTDRRSWRHVVDRLADRHRCITFDARGYGETTYEPEDGWSIPADAAAVLDAVGTDRVVVVACSMGGGAALEFALDHPSRVEAMVLVATAVGGAPYPDESDEPIATLDRRMEEVEEAGDLDELHRLERWVWLDGPDAEGRVTGPARDLFDEMNRHALGQPDPGERVRRDDTWDRLGEIDIPVLVLVGDLDVPDLKDICAQLPERLPDAGLVWLSGVAHLPHLEGHEETLELIEDFVDGRLPGA